MTDDQETTDTEDTTPSGSATLPPLRPPCERLSCHKSSVCSRSYFVVVMVFFHVYIINVIALLFYVHYSSGQEDASRSRDAQSSGHQRPESGPPPSKTEFLRDVSLTRIEGIRVSTGTMHHPHSLIHSPFLSLSLSLAHWAPPSHLSGSSFQVGHVQKVSLVPGRVHEMRTLSLKPLLFGESQNKRAAHQHEPLVAKQWGREHSFPLLYSHLHHSRSGQTRSWVRVCSEINEGCIKLGQ